MKSVDRACRINQPFRSESTPGDSKNERNFQGSAGKMLPEAFFVQPEERGMRSYESGLINHLFESVDELSRTGDDGSGPD
jgi:hypothetical protein